MESANDQGDIDVANGRGDSGGAIEDDGEVDPLGHDRLEKRQLVADALNGANDVGTRLAEDDYGDRPIVIHVTRQCAHSAGIDDKGDVACCTINIVVEIELQVIEVLPSGWRVFPRRP